MLWNTRINLKWLNLYKIKQEANVAIEEKRSKKVIGSSLEAEIKIFTDKKNFELLDNLNLSEYFITSKAERVLSEKEEIKVEVKKADGKKCERCWKLLEKKCERLECPIQ